MKLPFAFSASAPWLGPLTISAVMLLPSASVSLPSTPGAATVSVLSSLTAYVSLPATGAALVCVAALKLHIGPVVVALPSFSDTYHS